MQINGMSRNRSLYSRERSCRWGPTSCNGGGASRKTCLVTLLPPDAPCTCMPEPPAHRALASRLSKRSPHFSSCQGGASCGLDFPNNLGLADGSGAPLCGQEGGPLGEGHHCPRAPVKGSGVLRGGLRGDHKPHGSVLAAALAVLPASHSQCLLVFLAETLPGQKMQMQTQIPSGRFTTSKSACWRSALGRGEVSMEGRGPCVARGCGPWRHVGCGRWGHGAPAESPGP